MKARTGIAVLAGLLTQIAASGEAARAGVHADFPEQARKDARYVIYSHGRIVEGDDERPVSPDFGVYDFPGIRAALTRSGDFELIAPHREKNADVKTHADRIDAGVRRLVTAGVAPSRITLVGFSRGGYIMALASSRLADLRVNTALMATCMEGLPGKEPLVLAGNVLSIYETSDENGTCGGLRGKGVHFEEVELSTGLRHGAFYRPIEAWLAPLLAWISRTNR